MALGKAATAAKNAANKKNETTQTEVQLNIAPESVLIPLEVIKIHADPDQPRKEWLQGEIDELKASIAATNGCISPIKVKPHPTITGEFMLIFGEGRWTAHKELGAGFEMINCLLDTNEINDFNLVLQQTVENFSRFKMKAIDEANSFNRLMTLHDPKLKQNQLAQMLGCQQSYISRSLKLLKADQAIQDLSINNVTQNVNVLAYLEQISRLVEEAEMIQIIADVKTGALSEKELQRTLKELKSPEQENTQTDDFTMTEERQTSTGSVDSVSDSENQETTSSSKKTDQDYGFYDYENIFEKAIFDTLIKFDKAFDINGETLNEMVEKLEKVTEELEQEHDIKLSQILALLVENSEEDSVIPTLLNTRSLRQFMRPLVEDKMNNNDYAELHNSNATLTIESYEVIEGGLLATLKGIESPLFITTAEIKEIADTFDEITKIN